MVDLAKNLKTVTQACVFGIRSTALLCAFTPYHDEHHCVLMDLTMYNSEAPFLGLSKRLFTTCITNRAFLTGRNGFFSTEDFLYTCWSTLT